MATPMTDAYCTTPMGNGYCKTPAVVPMKPTSAVAPHTDPMVIGDAGMFGVLAVLVVAGLAARSKLTR